MIGHAGAIPNMAMLLANTQQRPQAPMPQRGFMLPANGQASPEMLDRKRKMAEMMMAEGMQSGPIASPWQGAARLAQSLVGGYNLNKADKAEGAGRASARDAMIAALSGNGGNEAMLGYLSDPFADATGKAIVGQRWQQMNPGPVDPLELEHKRLQNQYLGGQIAEQGKPDPQARPLTPEEMQQFGANGYRDPSGAVHLPEQPSQPSAVQEYQFAVGQGFKGTFQDWEASKKGGMQLHVDPSTGEVTFQQGSNIKPMTESQSKDANWSTRAEGALQDLEPIADELSSFGQSTGGQVPMIGNSLKTEKYQIAETAGREFLAAILRKDSGGAVTPEEIQTYGDTYLPRPFDKPGNLEQKKQARRRAVEALKAGMTPQAILAQEQALRNSATGGADAQAPDAGSALKQKYGLE